MQRSMPSSGSLLMPESARVTLELAESCGASELEAWVLPALRELARAKHAAAAQAIVDAAAQRAGGGHAGGVAVDLPGMLLVDVVRASICELVGFNGLKALSGVSTRLGWARDEVKRLRGKVKDLRARLLAAGPGAVISVSAGRYFVEGTALQIVRGCRLVGANAHVESTGDFPAIEIDCEEPEDAVQLDGLTVSAQIRTVIRFGVAVSVRAGSASLVRLKCLGSVTVVGHGASATIEDAEIGGCRGDGISAYMSKVAVVRSTIRGCEGSGIWCRAGVTSTVDDCTLSQNQGHGVRVEGDGALCSLRRNTITQSGLRGLYAGSGGKAEVLETLTMEGNARGDYKGSSGVITFGEGVARPRAESHVDGNENGAKWGKVHRSESGKDFTAQEK